MSSKIIIANWKMNGSRALVDAVAAAVVTTCRACGASQPDVVICPPDAYLARLIDRLDGAAAVGGQNMAVERAKNGAQTGDVSGAILVDVGATYVIIGHSERRTGHGETDADVRNKAAAAITAGLIPIICVGESAAIRDGGQAETYVKNSVLASIPENARADNMILAYEPVWAIGAGTPASVADITAMHLFLNDILTENQMRAPLLYGGSVKADNAGAILVIPHVDGVLVGGASLKPEEFTGIIRAGGSVE